MPTTVGRAGCRIRDLADRLGAQLRAVPTEVGTSCPYVYDRPVNTARKTQFTHGATLPALSPREREVIAMASAGLTNPQIANRLAISVHGVKFHLASVYRKLGVANRTQAATRFVQLSSTGTE